MAKMNKTLNFSNAEFKVSKDEKKDKKRIMILELGKDEDVWTDFDDVLEYFAEEDGLKISIKVEKNGFNE